jgi:hypothetical protein
MRYRTIVADPPWDHSDGTGWNPGDKDYRGPPRSGHSAKPEAFLDIVESVSPGPYLELFARRQRLGWDTWGDEALEHVTVDSTRSAGRP